MHVPHPILCFLFSWFILFTRLFDAHAAPEADPSPASPYLSPATFAPNYDDMLKSFKIFIYHHHHHHHDQPRPESPAFKSKPESLFYNSLLNSPFVTLNPREAHLFFVPFASDLSPRSIARLVRDLRAAFPYWNHTLGADHFYLYCDGLGYSSDRNLLELKKNSVQISCFPAQQALFVPHKDITLPPFSTPPPAAADSHSPANESDAGYLVYVKHGTVKDQGLVDELVKDPGFLIEAEPSDEATYVRRLASSEFCLLVYGDDVSWIADALRSGCVPVVITDRPIQDLPYLDVLRWQQMAVFVAKSGGVKGVKRVVGNMSGGRLVKRMRELGVAASRHFVWNGTPQPFDSFHTVMYQLWKRRHAVRYARRDWAS